MKHNLKNRPKRKRHHIPEMGYEYYYDEEELDDWFEGLEAELHEIKREKEHWNKNFEGGHSFNNGQIELIKGLLGLEETEP